MRWRPLYSASSWRTVIDAMRSHAAMPGGADGAISNSDAVALVEALRDAARPLGVGFPGWEGLEAIAYGYESGDVMYADEIQRDIAYDDEWTGILWDIARGIADELDRRDRSTGARVLRLDEASWASGVLNVQREVAKKECRVPLPTVPPDKWPTCEEVAKKIKEKLKKHLPPDKVVPVLPIIVALKRLIPIVVGGIIVGWLLDNNNNNAR